MRKKVGIIKRLFTLLLIFLLGINSFAAVISDSDGSAFITKKEFDDLKNSFKTQIDSYNASIDRKTDGAIASYLAGIRFSGKTEVSLCGGSTKRLAFFTPSVQTTNWKRGFMGIDVTEQKNGVLRRSGSYDYFGIQHFSRDAATKPFEALIYKDSKIFYTNNYQLTYHSNIWNSYFNKNQTANYYGYIGGKNSWHGCDTGGTLSIINNSTSGSQGGGRGCASHYPLRSDWFLVHTDYTFGSVVAGASANNYGTWSDQTDPNYIFSIWKIDPSFTDNLEYVDKQFFCTQGSSTSKLLQTWTYDLTSITTVADLESGWTEATSRSASLPSGNNVLIDNQFAGTSLAQSTNWSTQRANEAGSWAEKTSTNSSNTVTAGTWYEPELQMVERSHSIAWIDKDTYINDVGIQASTWNAYPYNGFPIVKWDPDWASLTIDVNNTNGDSMRVAFSDTQFTANSWISSYSNSKIKIELDGAAVSGSNFTLPTGSHKITIMPATSTTTLDKLFIIVGWNSTTKNTRGYLDIPNIGTAVIE